MLAATMTIGATSAEVTIPTGFATPADVQALVDELGRDMNRGRFSR